MLQLNLFGVPSLQRDGELFTGRVTQRHRLALLALLATAPGQRLSRDKLLGLLWPESDDDRGRNLLKTSTYVIRTELDENAVLTSGDELRLNPDIIQCDVAQFEAALEQRDYARATSLYAGPLLDGFHLSDAPEFEHWLDGERTRLAGRYRNALEALADSAAQSGAHAKAVDWWKLLAAQDPYDSRVALRLMSALDASGNRAGALQHAAVHQRMLQEEYGVAPPADFAALLERLRLTPAAEQHLFEPDLYPIDKPPAIEKQPKKPAPAFAPKSPPRWLASAAMLLIVALGSTVWLLRSPGDMATPPQTDGVNATPPGAEPAGATQGTSIAVLPFVNLSGDEENEYFSDGLTEEVITRLASVPGLKVISRTSAMHYKGSDKPLPEIARELNVNHILEGSVRREQGEVRVSAQLIDARTDAHLWANNFQHRLSDSFRVQQEIAREVADALQLRLAADTRRLLIRPTTQNAEAYALYQRARFLWNTRTRDGHARALDYYQQAIARDLSYADAYAGIAHLYLTAFQLNLLDVPEADAYQRVMWATERALALDDESAEAHVAQAVAFLWQKNWPGAEREFKRSIELNPAHATAYSWYSLLLRGMGRGEEALRESQRAIELDPFGVVINSNHGWHLYHERDYDGAITQLQRALEIGPFPAALRSIGMAYAQKAMWPEAIDAVRRAIESAPERPEFAADLAYVLARAGQPAEARTRLRDARMRERDSFNVGRAHMALNQPDSAFVWLARTSWHWPNRASLDDPALDPVRNDPRFQQLRQRIRRDVGLQ